MAYKKVVRGAVGGAAGVIHMTDSATTDCQPNENVEALRVYMDVAGIEARPVWKPMHKQPVYCAPLNDNGEMINDKLIIHLQTMFICSFFIIYQSSIFV